MTRARFHSAERARRSSRHSRTVTVGRTPAIDASRTAARGFTLLEVVVALALGVIVVTAAGLVLTQVLTANRRQHFLSEMARDGQFASQLMEQEVRQAGLGVPGDFMVWQTCDASNVCTAMYGTGEATTNIPLRFTARRILIAGASDLGFVGDLPRPDANYNAFGPIDNAVTGVPGTPDLTHIAWHTENNGSCVVGSTPCASGLSMWFPAALGTCTSGTNGASSLICPWSSRRIAQGERLQIVDGLGQWAIAAASNTTAGTSGSGVVGLQLSFGFDQSQQSGGSCAAASPVTCPWQTMNHSDGPQGFIGQGFVTTLDRVFYHYDSAKQQILRIQCWGDPDPYNPKWPVAVDPPTGITGGNNTMPSPFVASSFAYAAPPDLSNKSTAATCTAPEVIARNVKSVQLSYFDAIGTLITPTSATPAGGGAGLNAIKRVAWVLSLEVNDKQVGLIDYTIEGGTALQN